MTKAELNLLEKVFDCEVRSALRGNGIPEYQTKSKLAKKLESEGYLVQTESLLGGRFPVRVIGYTLTHAGRMAYCMTCEGEI